MGSPDLASRSLRSPSAADLIPSATSASASRNSIEPLAGPWLSSVARLLMAHLSRCTASATTARTSRRLVMARTASATARAGITYCTGPASQIRPGIRVVRCRRTNCVSRRCRVEGTSTSTNSVSSVRMWWLRSAAGPVMALAGPAALRSHHIRTELTEFVDVLVPSTRQRRDTQFVRLHRTTRMPGRIWEVGPVQYVMPARAVADAVRAMTSLRDVRAVVADAVQRDKCAISNLATELGQGPAKGSMLFREALADVADGIRSAAEGDLRDLLARS